MVKAVGFRVIADAEPGALQLIEVLPEPEYRDSHLPGAESIPLKNLNRETVDHLNPEAPVVVYCWDAY